MTIELKFASVNGTLEFINCYSCDYDGGIRFPLKYPDKFMIYRDIRTYTELHIIDYNEGNAFERLRSIMQQ